MDDSLTIRKITQKDSSKVIKLLFKHLEKKKEEELFLGNMASNWLEKFNRMISVNNFISLGAFLDGKETLVGVTTLYILPRLELVSNYAVIEDVFVKEDFRGKGIGSELIKKAIYYAEESRCEHVSLNIDPNNKTVRNFYEKLGFKLDSLGMVFHL